MSSIKLVHIVVIRYQTWPPQAIIVEDFLKLANQKEELPLAAMFVDRSELNQKFYRRPSIDASYQVGVHLAKRFQRKSFP
jgi:hypothetical protein